jgi:hypothetical protein
MDVELFTQKLSGAGKPEGDAHRATYTERDVIHSALAWNGSRFALAWLAASANGAEDCHVSTCNVQVHVTELDDGGAPASTAVKLSDDPNPSSNLALAWDGGGWTAVWQLPRYQRQQIFYGRMTCDPADNR